MTTKKTKAQLESELNILQKKNCELQKQVASLQSQKSVIGDESIHHVSDQAKELLRKSEEQYRNIFENAAEGIFQSTPQGRFLKVNPTMARIYGYDSPEEMVASITDISRQIYVNSEERNKFQSILKETGRINNFEAENLRKDGTHFWVSSNARMVRGEDGTLLYYEGTVHDLTGRKRIEQQLQKSGRLYRGLVNQLPGIVYTDDAFNRSEEAGFVSQQIETITGYSVEEWKRESLWKNRLHKDDSDRVFAEYQKCLKGYQPFDCEYRLLAKDGRVVWVHDRSAPLMNDDNQPYLMVGIAEDITAHKQNEAEIRRQILELEALYESGLKINRLLPPKEIAQKLIEVLEEKLNWHHIAVRLHQPETNTMELVAFSQPGISTAEAEERLEKMKKITFRSDQGLSGWVTQHGKPVRVAQVKKDERYFESFPGIQSGLYIPLKVGERVIGSISVESEQENAFTEQNERLLVTLAGQAAIAIENARLYVQAQQEIKERMLVENERQRVVHDLGERVKELTALHDASRIFMDSSKTEKEVLRELVGILPPAWQYPEITAAGISVGEEHCCTPNFTKTPWMQSQLSILPNGQKCMIEIAYLEERPEEDEGPFLKEERYLLETLAERLQSYLTRRLVDTEVELHNRELSLLLDAGRELSSTQNMQTIYDIVYRYISRWMPCDTLIISSYEPDAQMIHCDYLRTIEGVQDSSQFPAIPLEPEGKGTQSLVIRGGKSIVLPDYRKQLETANTSYHFDDQGGIVEKIEDDAKQTRSAILVPVTREGRVMGVLQVFSNTLNAYNESHLRFAEALLFRVSAALSNAEIFHELQVELLERRIIEEEIRHMNVELEQHVMERTAEIEATRRRLELATSTAGIGIWDWDIKNDIHYWDDHEFTLLGLSKEAVKPDLAISQSVVHPDDRQKRIELLNKSMSEKQPYESEFRVVWPDESIHYIKGNGIVLYDAKGEPERMIGVNQDITIHKKAEETLRLANVEMERALRMKDEFLASMSHELRTPLNAILGISESLEEQIAGSLTEKQRKYIRTISESGHHLLELINDILDLSKIEAGRMELVVASISVDSLCQSSLRMVKEQAHKKTLRVSLRVDPAARTFKGDERRLKQSLVNLLSNAVKFTPEGGEIGLEVDASLKDKTITFTVWDHGIGIAPENINRLFKPFVQLNAGLSREYSGTGLGLALVDQMIRLHNGKVTVETELGKGSRFSIILPWDLGTQPISVKIMPRIPTADLGPAEKRYGRILLVEDTSTVVFLISEYLRFNGFEVIVARNGVEGVLYAKNEHPDLILMDVMMPVMDGLEATRQIRMDPSLRKVPIIALTALAMSGDKDRCIEAGMNDYISKPVELKELVAQIHRYLPGNGADHGE